MDLILCFLQPNSISITDTSIFLEKLGSRNEDTVPRIGIYFEALSKAENTHRYILKCNFYSLTS